MIYVIMGVCGSGKTTIGKALSKILKIPFIEGDDYHPNSNIDKMSCCIPLEDNDRIPWLEILSEKINLRNKEGDIILACSALRESYRQILNKNNNCIFIFLNGDKNLILERLKKRINHFMPKSLLESQFSTLEIPDYAIEVPINQTVEKIVFFIANKIKNEIE